jgi:hypothetical protein
MLAQFFLSGSADCCGKVLSKVQIIFDCPCAIAVFRFAVFCELSRRAKEPFAGHSPTKKI